MRRSRLWGFVMGVLALVASGGCGAVRVVEQGEPRRDGEEGKIEISIDPCAIVERDEMAVAIGAPLDVERLQVWDENYYCEWMGGGPAAEVTSDHAAWAEFEVSRQRSTPEATLAEKDEGAETVPGLGTYATLYPDPAYGELQVGTPGGAVIYLRWEGIPGVTPEFRARLTELAQRAIERVDPLLPGNAAALPKLTPPAIHPCRAIPNSTLQRQIGVPGGEVPREHFGGAFGGYWFCERSITRSDGERSWLGALVTKAAVAPQDVPRIGDAVPELGAGAWFRPPRREGDRIRAAAVVVFVGPEQRLIALRYGDAGRDDAQHRQTLIELARAFGRT